MHISVKHSENISRLYNKDLLCFFAPLVFLTNRFHSMINAYQQQYPGLTLSTMQKMVWLTYVKYLEMINSLFETLDLNSLILP